MQINSADLDKWGVRFIEEPQSIFETLISENRPTVIVLDEAVWSAWKDLGLSDWSKGVEGFIYVVSAPAESEKSLKGVSKLYDFLASKKINRTARIVAVGGGAVGDMAGFVAATWMRGVDYEYVPTTLLAMVDSCLGGKTAINLQCGKNLVGALHYPRRIWVSLKWLQTLNSRQLASGMAEVIKMGLLTGGDFWDFVCEGNGWGLKFQEIEPSQVQAALAWKARFIDGDLEDKKGQRAFLNLGHTFGHGLEAATDYTQVLHGEAVAIGLHAAVIMSESLKLVDGGLGNDLRNVLDRYQLESCLGENVNINRAIEAISLDKKNIGGDVSFVLLEGVGKPLIQRNINSDLVKETFYALSSRKFAKSC